MENTCTNTSLLAAAQAFVVGVITSKCHVSSVHELVDLAVVATPFLLLLLLIFFLFLLLGFYHFFKQFLV